MGFLQKKNRLEFQDGFYLWFSRASSPNETHFIAVILNGSKVKTVPHFTVILNGSEGSQDSVDSVGRFFDSVSE